MNTVTYTGTAVYGDQYKGTAAETYYDKPQRRESLREPGQRVRDREGDKYDDYANRRDDRRDDRRDYKDCRDESPVREASAYTGKLANLIVPVFYGDLLD